MKIVDELIFFFSRVSLSRSSLRYMGIRGIYTGVCLECRRSIFPKQSGLATWPRDLIHSRGQVARPLCLGKIDLLHSKHTPI